MNVSTLLKTFAFETKLLLVDVRRNKTYSIYRKQYFNEYVTEWDGEVARVTNGKIAVFYKSGIGL